MKNYRTEVVSYHLYFHRRIKPEGALQSEPNLRESQDLEAGCWLNAKKCHVQQLSSTLERQTPRRFIKPRSGKEQSAQVSEI